MTFSEFATMMYPFLRDGKNQSDFVVFLVGSVIEETDDTGYSLLDKKPDY